MDTTPSHALPAGALFGRYEILEFVASGGMGEVYRARDSVLDRTVALKVLPSRLASDEKRLRLFERECRLLARLSHPNIVAIYDAGSQDGVVYFTTEFLEGETLRDLMERIEKLEIPRAVDLAVQICQALAAAHEEGVLHRDLKPGNVFVTRDDHVKLLDFGIAKLSRGSGNGTQSGDPTETSPGAVMGSPSYMSPEQAEATKLDERSDIFSFGSMLYEMIGGARPFVGRSTTDTLAAVLRDAPRPLSELRSEAPRTLVRIVRRCLEKDPEHRFQTARELLVNLEEIRREIVMDQARSEDVSVRAVAAGLLSGKRLRFAGAIAVGLLVLAAATSYVVTSRRLTASSPERIEPPARSVGFDLRRVTSGGVVGSGVAISPDGAYVAYAGAGLQLTHLPTGSVMKLVDEVIGPIRFSPDGNWIYFVRVGEQGDLYRIPILGGEPILVARGVTVGTGTIAFDPGGGRLAFTRVEGGSSQLVMTSADGSTEAMIAARPPGETFLECAWSRDGTRFVCSAAGAGGEVSMLQVDSATGTDVDMPRIRALRDVTWSPDGRSLYGVLPFKESSQIWRVELATGAESQITNDLSRYAGLDLTSDGSTLVATRTDTSVNLWSVHVDEPHELRQITTGLNTYDGNFGLAVSSRGRIVWASGVSGKGIDLWSSNLDGSDRRRLTFDDQSDEKWPCASPDGMSIAFVREGPRPGSRDLWMLGIDGADLRQITTTGSAGNPHFTSDGKAIVFSLPSGPSSLYSVPIEGGEPREVDSRPGSVPMPSPDGLWVLVADGANELELRATRDESVRVLEPASRFNRWRGDSKALAYLTHTKNVAVRSLDDGGSVVLTDFRDGSFVTPGLDWTPDSSEIVFARRSHSRDVVLIGGLQ